MVEEIKKVDYDNKMKIDGKPIYPECDISMHQSLHHDDYPGKHSFTKKSFLDIQSVVPFKYMGENFLVLIRYKHGLGKHNYTPDMVIKCMKSFKKEAEYTKRYAIPDHESSLIKFYKIVE